MFWVLLSRLPDFYLTVRYNYPNTLYAPQVMGAKRSLPPWLAVEVFDKGVEMPSFKCFALNRQKHRNLFYETPRYNEVLRFKSRGNADFHLFWSVLDSFSLITFHRYSPFSVVHGVSPVPPAEVEHYLTENTLHRPS